MAYSFNNLSALAYANGFTLWHYKSPDAVHDMAERGYFNGAATMLRVGDFIMVNGSVGGVVQPGMLFVRSNTGTIVEIESIFTDFSETEPED